MSRLSVGYWFELVEKKKEKPVVPGNAELYRGVRLSQLTKQTSWWDTATPLTPPYTLPLPPPASLEG